MGVLCFGSYATILKNAMGKISNEELVPLLFRGIEPTITSLDKGDCNNWVKSNKDLPDYISSKADVNEVVHNIENYFSINIIPKLKSALSNGLEQSPSKILLESLYGLIISDDGILPDIKKTLIQTASVEKASSFLSRSFIHAVMQPNKIDGDPLKDTFQMSLPKVDFEKTLNSKNFNDIFITVEGCKDSNPFNIEFRRLSISNKEFEFVALGNYLQKNLGRYIFSRAKIEKMISDEEQELIGQQAINYLKNKGNFSQLGDEMGNMVLYVMLEELLNAPKIFYQIESSVDGTLINNGGIHLLRIKGLDNSHQIIFGKSKLIGDLISAIDSAFEAVTNSISNDIRNLPLLEPTIMSQFADKETRDYLKSILIPTRREKTANIDNAFGIFLGYNLGIQPCAEFSKLAEEKINADIKACIPHIHKKISELNLSKYPFYFYVIPFNDIDNDKQTVISMVCGGGVS